jgi:hypothetical protein
MAIATALDDDLVGAAPQHRASPPALAPVDLIAKAHGKLAQIYLPFEGFQLRCQCRDKTPAILPVLPTRGGGNLGGDAVGTLQ